uniref:thiamin biosynthesis protein G n=1 Tax=Ochrosphaera neapolitana TaxID=35137 RepID=UPI00286C71A6|nr:thiamin biosynthesis protein G [Ochrosphaera neapolitana]WKK50146.1 thiamin biosynthesis protein G [Ochrosphaera neapolitana]
MLNKNIVPHQLEIDDPLIISHKKFQSRLMLGTGKYRNFSEAKESIDTSGCEILTVAVRRAQNTNMNGIQSLLKGLDWKKIWLMPNTAGCQTAEEAIRVAFLGREICKNLGYQNNNFIKLEVIPDPKYLLPDGLGTLMAAEYLVTQTFTILPYMNADPVLAKQLENIGCSTVMPLGSPIGSGQGIKNLYNIKIIIENADVPVIIDAGIGTPSQAAAAMECGAGGILTNTAIAKAKSAKTMAHAMKLGVLAGRLAFQAGQVKMERYAQPSSTVKGLVNL